MALTACALLLGSCAKDGTAPSTGTVAPLKFVQLSAGDSHTCGIASGGALYCWGNNAVGELGNGTWSLANPAPVAVTGGLTVAGVTTGYRYTCAVTVRGGAYCWGANYLSGQLGIGMADTAHTDTLHLAPVPVTGGVVFASLSAGGWPGFTVDLGHTCGLTVAGTAYCWGGNVWGDLGHSTRDTLPHPDPVAVSGGLTFQSVGAGSGLSCGLSAAGAAYCWGYGSVVGDTTPAATPALVPGGLTFQSLTVGGMHACGLTEAGAVYCWGWGVMGDLGDGNRYFDTLPRGPAPVLGGLTFRSVSAGVALTCGITTNGAAYCWGSDVAGQLGTTAAIGSCTTYSGPFIPLPCSAVPVPVADGLTFASVAAGNGHACGLTTGGVAYCWGDNGWGELGDGTTNGSSTPVRVAGQQ